MHLPPLPGPALTVCHYALSLSRSLPLSAHSSLPVSLSVPQAWIITSKACAGMDHLSCTLSLSLALCMLLPACLSLSLSVRQAWIITSKDSCRIPLPLSACPSLALQGINRQGIGGGKLWHSASVKTLMFKWAHQQTFPSVYTNNS